MTDLLTKMEVELNNIHKKRKEIMLDGTNIITKQQREHLSEINAAQVKLRKMIADYIAIQNQFLELTGKLSLNY